MALKKKGNSMKMITIIIALCMIIPIAIQGYVFFANRENKTVMLTVNGEKIYKEDFDRNYANLLQQFSRLDDQIIATNNLKKEEYKSLPEVYSKAYLLSREIASAVDVSLEKQLGAKVSKSEVEEEFKKLEAQLGGSAALVSALNAQGQTVASVREEISKNILETKKIDILKTKIQVTDEEVQQLYDTLKFNELEDKSFAEVKDQVRDRLLNSRAEIYAQSLREDIFNKATIDIKDESIKEAYDKLQEDFYEEGEFKFKVNDIISQIVSSHFAGAKGFTDDILNNVKESVKTDLARSISIRDKAIEAGLSVNPELLPKYQLMDIISKFVTRSLATYKADESELRTLYTQFGDALDIQHQVSGEVFGKVYVSGKEDEEQTKVQIEELMKTINKDNFAEKAKELSKDPGSAQNGGSLGKADITRYVPEFGQALAKAQAGDIIGPVKTQFGFHIIYVEDIDANNRNVMTLSHILLPVQAGDKTKADTKAQVEAIKNDIVSGKITWDQVNENKEKQYPDFVIESFSKIKEAEQLPIVGYSKSVNDRLFAAKVGEFIEVTTDDSYVLIQKTEDVPHRKVTFEEVKDKLNLFAANLHLQDVLK